ncbi:hypothetical protein H0R92_03790 [Treponema sp. OMZ 840]|uniref:hypothetical protein n=1 Tax=Treponema sp. OMZ 840 TaxID=244313 RepID=UPI003D93F41D
MKKSFKVVLPFILMISIHSFLTGQTDNSIVQLEILRDKEPSLALSEFTPCYEYASLFYQDLCFRFDLLRRADRIHLRKSCKTIFDFLKQGYKVRFVVKNYEGEQDLRFNFSHLENETDTLLILSNYNAVENRILKNNEGFQDAWALLYYIIDGKPIYYKDVDKREEQNENSKNISQLRASLKNNPTPLAYINIVELYYRNNKIKKGLTYLQKNKDKIIAISIPSNEKGNIHDLIACVEESGRALEMLTQ